MLFRSGEDRVYHTVRSILLQHNALRAKERGCHVPAMLAGLPQGPDRSQLLEICPRGNNKCSYYYIFVFMINVYIHAIIILTRNINTCVICKLK